MPGRSRDDQDRSVASVKLTYLALPVSETYSWDSLRGTVETDRMRIFHLIKQRSPSGGVVSDIVLRGRQATLEEA